MTKRVLVFFLALLLCAGLAVPAYAAAPKARIRDIQRHVWTQYIQEAPEPNSVCIGSHGKLSPFGCGYLDNKEHPIYSTNDLFNADVATVAHFILYDNGELYLSKGDEPTESSFRKVMDNVKEIGWVSLPTFLYHEEYQCYGAYGNSFYTGSYDDDADSVMLTTILTEDGELYVMGVPQSIPEDIRTLTNDEEVAGGIIYRSTVSVEEMFPLAFSDSSAEQEDAVLIADGIAHITPGYGYSVTLSYMNPGDHPTSYTRTQKDGFYTTISGENYIGFPIEGGNQKRLAGNVVNYIPSDDIQLLEDGTLQKAGKTVARDVKDFNKYYYLTNNGKVYNYDKKLLDSDVIALGGGGGGVGQLHMSNGDTQHIRFNACYIKADGSLYGSQGEKLMEDVAAAFDEGRYVARNNGEVYRMETENGNDTTMRKILSGNGYTPNPAPAIHAGKIFKDASSWALVDLRAARDSGLTVPADGLSYNQPITREKFAEVSVKLYEALSGAKAPAATKNPFTDTKNPEVLKAHALGIVKGTSPNTFSPNDKIDRESIATMLMRTVNAAGAKLPAGTPVAFADGGKISGWAKDAVTAMANANIIRGVGGGRFDPQGTATMEQSIIMANRILR